MNKCAMYIEANVHGNEVQGGEVELYTIWYLMENYLYNDYLKKLVDERVFYIFPSVNKYINLNNIYVPIHNIDHPHV